ncbi:HisA/HisF-related TIM barrel protein, partial [Lactococcus lactis]
MKIIPAIDLQNGEAVRLYKGDYDKKTVYSKTPLEIAQKFERMGATDLHLVDLDDANIGQTRNLEIVRKIKEETRLKIEIGGGIRDFDTVRMYLEQIGVERVILGTAAVEKPDFLK